MHSSRLDNTFDIECCYVFLCKTMTYVRKVYENSILYMFTFEVQNVVLLWTLLQEAVLHCKALLG